MPLFAVGQVSGGNVVLAPNKRRQFYGSSEFGCRNRRKNLEAFLSFPLPDFLSSPLHSLAMSQVRDICDFHHGRDFKHRCLVEKQDGAESLGMSSLAVYATAYV